MSERSERRADAVERVMTAEHWTVELEAMAARLEYQSIIRDMVGWGGTFLAIFLMIFVPISHEAGNRNIPWFIGCAAVSAPFAGWSMVGMWGDSWLTRVRKRRRGVPASPPYKRFLFWQLLVHPARSAAVVASVWFVVGCVLTFLITGSG